MNEKIIIKNQTELSTSEALRRVGQVIDGGKKSGRGDKSQYCHVSVFGDNVAVRCEKNKGDSFTFSVYMLTVRG